MYILVVAILVGARVVRDFRPLSARECLASAALIAADGVARGLAMRRREIGLTLVDQARAGGADPDAAASVRALLVSAEHASDRLHALQQRAMRLLPNCLRSPRWVSVVGWAMVVGASISVIFGLLGVALGGYLYTDKSLTLKLDPLSVATVILLASAGLTLGMSLPAMIARRRTDSLWPLIWLRNAALVFTLLNALVDFATEGFGALMNMSIGLFTLAIMSYHLDLAARSEAPVARATERSGTAR
jgi:hypothetical protein